MGSTVDNFGDALADCIDAAQEAAFGAGRWEALLERMAGAFPGTKVALASEQPRPLQNIGMVSYGYEPELIQEYVNHYSRINPWTPHWKKIPLLTAALTDHTLPSNNLKRREYYEFLVKVGEAKSASVIKLFEDHQCHAVITLHYDTRRSIEYNDTIPSFLNVLAPHLKRAVDLSARVAILSEPTTTLERALPQFATPAFLIDPRGVLLEANRAAHTLLDEGNVVRLLDGERLSITEETARSRLAAMTSAVESPPSAYPIVDERKSAWRLFEFNSGTFDRRMAWMPKAGKWVLALFEPSVGRTTTLARAQGFGLTPQETRVAAAIVDGLRVDAIADTLGISSNTVRQHLKAIFAKTGSHRQADLITKLQK